VRDTVRCPRRSVRADSQGVRPLGRTACSGQREGELVLSRIIPSEALPQGVDKPMRQPNSGVSTVGYTVAGLLGSRYFTLRISRRISPPGVSTDTLSPTFLPKIALPMGLLLLMRPLAGSASSEPTIV